MKITEILDLTRRLSRERMASAPRVTPGMALALGFFSCVICVVVAWALTTDQIWQSWYDSPTQSIKVTIVP